MRKLPLISSATIVWVASVFSLPLKFHLGVVLFSPRSLQDGQYVLVFPAAAAVGFISGIVPAALTIYLMRRKPKFGKVAILMALGYAGLWAGITTACEAIFAGKGNIGGGVLLSLTFLTIYSPVSLLFLVFVALFPFNALFGILSLSPLMGILVVAFYFTRPRGWKGEEVSNESGPTSSPT